MMGWSMLFLFATRASHQDSSLPKANALFLPGCGESCPIRYVAHLNNGSSFSLASLCPYMTFTKLLHFLIFMSHTEPRNLFSFLYAFLSSASVFYGSPQQKMSLASFLRFLDNIHVRGGQGPRLSRFQEK